MQINNLKDQNYPLFNALWDYYQSLPMQGLQAKAYLGSNYVPSSDGQIHLDSLLAYASSLDVGETLTPLNKSRPRVIPIPVKIAWVSPDGLPLFACTHLQPATPSARSTEYWHKRFPVSETVRYCSKVNTPTTRGPFKEYRIPMQVLTAESVMAYCIGNRNEIQRLLDNYAYFVGKKPSQGNGVVLKWEVTEIDMQESDILQSRSVPSMMLGREDGAIGAWTPPYWFRPWHLPLTQKTKTP